MIKYLLTILILLLSTDVWATPAVTGVSGTISDGSSVTITGSGFGTKSVAKPLIWANFDSGSLNPSSLGVMTSWTGNNGLSLNTNNQPPNSTYTVYGEYGGGQEGPDFRIDYNYYQKIYVFFKRYRDFAPPNPLNLKFFRIWPVSGGATNNFFAAFLTNADPNRVGRCYTENTGEDYSDSYQGSVYTEDVWQTEEFQWSQNSAVNASDGTWQFWRDGISVQDRNDLRGRSSAQQGNITRLYTDNYAGGSGGIYLPPNGSRVYMDDVYVDNTWSRVIIGNSNTLSGSTQREIQIPSAWSDSSVSVTLNQGSFSDLNSVYLYIVDSNGAVNANGYLLTGGGPPPPTIKLLLRRNQNGSTGLGTGSTDNFVQ
jgi:hypothetical protein